MARLVEQHEDYRVLRRLPWPRYRADVFGKSFRGVMVDCETTGLDTDKDEIIELAVYPFAFSPDGHIVALHPPYHSYNEPEGELSEEITAITGITPSMVIGQRLDRERIDQEIYQAEIVIAHNAAFDRKILERYSHQCAKARWGCSMEQVSWKADGMLGTRLEYIVISMGYFYKAHNAVADCQAALFALQHTMKDGRPALRHLLDATQPSWHVWAVGAPYDLKDILKKRGYFWNGGDDGRRKAWHKEVRDLEAEEAWLAQNVYAGRKGKPVCELLTARDRFSKRG